MRFLQPRPPIVGSHSIGWRLGESCTCPFGVALLPFFFDQSYHICTTFYSIFFGVLLLSNARVTIKFIASIHSFKLFVNIFFSYDLFWSCRAGEIVRCYLNYYFVFFKELSSPNPLLDEVVSLFENYYSPKQHFSVFDLSKCCIDEIIGSRRTT